MLETPPPGLGRVLIQSVNLTQGERLSSSRSGSSAGVAFRFLFFGNRVSISNFCGGEGGVRACIDPGDEGAGNGPVAIETGQDIL